jgi:hypothetical protein
LLCPVPDDFCIIAQKTNLSTVFWKFLKFIFRAGFWEIGPGFVVEEGC